MPDAEEKTRVGLCSQLSACLPSISSLDSDSKSGSLTCVTSFNSPPSSPVSMPEPTTTHTSPDAVSTMPLHLSSNHAAKARPSLPPRRRTKSQECYFVTIESEAWMEVLAKENIAFLDWEPPITRRYAPSVEKTSSAGDSGTGRCGRSSSSRSRQLSEDGHITVQIARRPLPGHQEGVSYVRYYRTDDGKPATRE